MLLKSAFYFSSNNIKIDVQNATLKKSIQNQLGTTNTAEPPFDIIYLDAPADDLLATYKDQIHNDTMLLIADIHKTETNTSLWNALKQQAAVTVSIDLYYCGALFFRKEQAKEHFTIRI